MDFKKLKNILVSNKHGDTPVHPSSHWFSPDPISSFVLSLTDKILQQFVVMGICMGDKLSKNGEIWTLRNFGLMWGCSFWLVFTGKKANQPSASGVKNRDGTFSRLQCPTRDFITSAGRCVLMKSYPDPDNVMTS